jgi:hypothetical protein
MKARLASALLLSLSSFTAAHAEWEILDPGMPGWTPLAASTTSIAPATSTASPSIAQRQPATK